MGLKVTHSPNENYMDCYFHCVDLKKKQNRKYQAVKEKCLKLIKKFAIHVYLHRSCQKV